MNLIDEVLNGAQELRRNVNETKKLVYSLLSLFGSRGIMNHNQKEKGMDTIRDALNQSASGRKLFVQVNDEMRTRAIERETAKQKAREKRMETFAIRGRYQSLKDLIHYTFVTFPNENHRSNRFDVYKASRARAWEIASEGGEAYDRVTRTLQYAPTSPKAFQEAVAVFTDCQHDFSEYESSDALRRHAA